MHVYIWRSQMLKVLWQVAPLFRLKQVRGRRFWHLQNPKNTLKCFWGSTTASLTVSFSLNTLVTRHSNPFHSSRIVCVIFVFASTHRYAKLFLLLRNVWKRLWECFVVRKSAKNVFPVFALVGKVVQLVRELLILAIFKYTHASYIHRRVSSPKLRECSLKRVHVPNLKVRSCNVWPYVDLNF